MHARKHCNLVLAWLEALTISTSATSMREKNRFMGTTKPPVLDNLIERGTTDLPGSVLPQDHRTTHLQGHKTAHHRAHRTTHLQDRRTIHHRDRRIGSLLGRRD